METWNERLAQALADSGLSKSGLARAVGVSAPTVTDWLNGEIKELKAKNAEKICRILKISSNWLLHGKGPQKPLISERSTSSESPIDNAFTAATPEIQQHVLGILEEGADYQTTTNDIDHLLGLATPRSQDALRQIAQAAADGRLTDDDLTLLASIAARFSGGTSQK